ncbi:TPA: zeta toxin family protein [Campylobacter jejuni]|nr:zeta toxin family protein [Campylobacter jejuni]
MSANFIIITGTNGVGKSTIGQNFSKQLQIPFINIDLFYFDKYKAYREYTQDEIIETSKEIFALREHYFKTKQSFMQETIITESKNILALLEKAKEYGFNTSLFYIGIDQEDVEISNWRVINRTKKGLHYVKPKDIQANLKDVNACFKELCEHFDNICIYDNEDFPKKILDIRNKEIYKKDNILSDFCLNLIQDTFIDELKIL